MLKLYGTDRTFLSYLMRYKDYHIEKDLESADSLLYLTYRGKNAKIKNECYVRTDDAYYVVKEVRPSDDGADIVCQLDLEDLERSVFDQFTADDKTITEAANLALAGTGWTVSTTITKKRSVQTFNARPRQILEKIRDAFMCELQYDNVNKIVTFKEEFGEYKGVYFRRDLNLKKLSTTIDSYDYYTRIIPIGADGLTIKSVNNNIEYLDNFQYSNKVKVFVWEDTSYEDASKLKEDATLKLADMSKPKTSYSADIIDLAKRSHTYDLLSFELGDAIDLIDELSGVNDRQRIVKMNIYPDEPERNTCEISNTVLTFEELQSRLDKAAAAWEEKSNTDGTIKGIYVHGVQADDVVYIETEQGQTTKTDVQTAITGVVGSLSSVSARVGTIEASYVTTTYLTTNYLTAQDISTTYLSASVAALTYATITSLQADEARIGTIEANYVSTTYLTTNYLTAQSISTTYLSAATAALTYATITSLQADEARIGTIEANYISSSAVAAGYAQITFANIDTANIDKTSVKDLFVSVGLIRDALIDQGKITGYLDAVSINAANITAGTLTTDRLVIRGSNSSIVYALNNITGAVQTQNVDTLNGEVITQRTITADRIVAGSITANEIATGTITALQIAAGTITANEIDVSDLFSQNITATGSITGALIHAAENSTIGDTSKAYISITGSSFEMYYDDTEFVHFGLVSATPAPGELDAYFTLGYRKGGATVKGAWSTAIGINIAASGDMSYGEGMNTTASGLYSHAEGAYSIADGESSHAGGYYTIANGDYQTAIGSFNVADTTSLFIVGKGTGANARSNALTLDTSGNLVISGTLTQGSDKSLKDEIAGISNNMALINLYMDLSPVSFRWKDKRNNDQHFGLIAQEVKEAFENHGINCGMVSHAEHYGLDYNEIHMLTMMMVQQQEQRLIALEKILQ